MYKIEIQISKGRYLHTIATNAEGKTYATNELDSLVRHILEPKGDDETKLVKAVAQKAVGYEVKGWDNIGDVEQGRIFNTSLFIPPMQTDAPIIEAIERVRTAVDAAAEALKEHRESILPDGIYGLPDPEPAKKTVRR